MHRARFLHALTQRNVRLERYVPSIETVRWAYDCLDASESSGDSSEILVARSGLATILLLHDHLDEADGQMVTALSAAERLGDLSMQSCCLTYLTMVHRRLRRVRRVVQLAEKSLSVAKAAQMSEYIGAALGNLAWIALERGDLAEAERAAREAISQWSSLSLVYPFQWLARLPLAKIELEQARVGESIEQVRAMLDPKQQRLPDKLAIALEKACVTFAKGRIARAEWILARAFRIARRCGYV